MSRVHKQEIKLFSRGLFLHTEEDQAEYVSEFQNNFMMHDFYLPLINYFFAWTESQVNKQAFCQYCLTSILLAWPWPLSDNLIHL